MNGLVHYIGKEGESFLHLYGIISFHFDNGKNLIVLHSDTETLIVPSKKLRGFQIQRD